MTKSIYRKFTALILGASAAMAVGATGAATAQVQSEYPSRPITLIVPYPAGGATDALARFIGAKLQDSWGQSVVIQNKPGASGIIGAQHVSQAAADGYTVLIMSPSYASNPFVRSRLPYDPVKDFTPVIQFVAFWSPSAARSIGCSAPLTMPSAVDSPGCV